jgi:glycosyltransferase 2 family protein
MNSSAVAMPEQDLRTSRLKQALAYAFAAACLVWVFHDVHPRELLGAISIGNWWFVALAIIADVLTYVLQGIRWKGLLAPVGCLSVRRATEGVYAGLFANELVPLRVGELVRAFLVSRWLSSSLTEVVPSMVVERFLDAICLAVGIGLAAMFVPLPKNLVKADAVLSGIVLLAVLLFLWLIYQRNRKEKRTGPGHSSHLLNWFSRLASQLASGIRDIGSSRSLFLAALASFAMLAFQILALWFMLLACNIDLAPARCAVVLLIVRLGTAIPNAPANIGSHQFFCVLALSLFGVEKTVAAGFSIVYFFALTLPLWIFGLLALSRTGLSLATIRASLTILCTAPKSIRPPAQAGPVTFQAHKGVPGPSRHSKSIHSV